MVTISVVPVNGPTRIILFPEIPTTFAINIATIAISVIGVLIPVNGTGILPAVAMVIRGIATMTAIVHPAFGAMIAVVVPI
jgi:hypothetical protein